VLGMTLLENMLRGSGLGLHGHTLKALLRAVRGLLVSERLTLTGIGRCLDGSAHEKHKVKQVDRLLGHAVLQRAAEAVASAAARWLAPAQGFQVVLVDWTSCPSRDYMQLEAALPLGGRALPLYHRVHRMSSYKNPRVQARFVRGLAKQLGARAQVVVVADAGFQRSFFEAVEAQGWHWVVRLGGVLSVQPVGDTEWHALETLHTKARVDGRDLGEYQLCRQRPYSARVCVVSPAKRGRRHTTREREHGHGTVATRCRRANGAPWVLATNLPNTLFGKTDIVRLYEQRMQIEQMFRDVKSTRFGYAMDYHGTRRCARQAVLRLLGTLALFVQCVVGLAVERRGLARHFQVNTERRRRVLSWTTLARRVWRNARYLITGEDLTASCADLTKRMVYQPLGA